jgi:hypothetical protein
MSIEEYVRAVENFGQLSSAEQTPYLVFHLTDVSGARATPKTVTELRTRLRLPAYARISAHFSERSTPRSGMPLLYVKLPDGSYALERELGDKIRAQTSGRATARATARDLRALVATVGDSAVRSYMEEAVGCFEDGHFRAAIVFTWCAAYSVFRLWLFSQKLSLLNTQLATWAKPKVIAVIDDFQELQEGTVIETSRKARIISKEQEKLLAKLLDERNSYAHASTVTASSPIAEAFIERAIKGVINVYV